MNPKLIAILAAPSPKCFADRLSWVEYLQSCMEVKAKEQGQRPFLPNNRFNPDFSPCRDCTPDHEACMRREGRCQRNAFAWTSRPTETQEVPHAAAA